MQRKTGWFRLREADIGGDDQQFKTPRLQFLSLFVIAFKFKVLKSALPVTLGNDISEVICVDKMVASAIAYA